MGLSVDDFLGMDTDEFDSAVKAFGEHEDQQERERWERMRLLGLMTVQPWSKGKLTAEKLLPLPWDKECKREGGAARNGAKQSPAEFGGKRMTKAEHRERAEEMLKLLGERY